MGDGRQSWRGRLEALAHVRTSGGRARRSLLLLVAAVVSAGVLVPAVAGADTSTSGAAYSSSVRYWADLSPLANGGVLVDTAIATGGVPTEGEELVGLGSSGAVDWSTPYQNQDTIAPPPVSDAAGNRAGTVTRETTRRSGTKILKQRRFQMRSGG